MPIHKMRLLYITLASQLLLSCSIAREESAPTPQKTAQEGKATIYDDSFQGKKTASGDTFNQHEGTAAHKTLPLGSKAKVTNLETGKSTTVEINDRGPNVSGKTIDLSKKAAKDVGLTTNKGVAEVKIETNVVPTPVAK